MLTVGGSPLPLSPGVGAVPPSQEGESGGDGSWGRLDSRRYLSVKHDMIVDIGQGLDPGAQSSQSFLDPYWITPAIQHGSNKRSFRSNRIVNSIWKPP